MVRLKVVKTAGALVLATLTFSCVRHEIKPGSDLNKLAGRCVELTGPQKIVRADSGNVVGFLAGSELSGVAAGDELGNLSPGARLIIEAPILDDRTLGNAYVDIVARPLSGPVMGPLRIRSVFDAEWLSAAKTSILENDRSKEPVIAAALDDRKARWCPP